MKKMIIFLLLALLSCACLAQDIDKQAREEANKAFKEKRIDVKGFTELIGKINNGKSAEVIKELSEAPRAPKASLYSDWPQWLGPNRNGSSPEKGLLREWPSEGPKMLWAFPVTKGWGSVCVSKGEVFLSGLGKNYTIHCLDAFTGKEKWKFEYELGRKKLDIGWGWCPRDTIAATEKYIYSQNEQGQLYCIDRQKGTKVRMRDLDAEYGTSHNDWKGWCQSPLVEDGIVFMAAAGLNYKPGEKARYFGFDAETGKTVWEAVEPPGPTPHRFGGADPSQTASVVFFGGEKCALVTANGKLFAIRFKDGKKIWTHEKAHVQQHMTGPIIIGDQILLS
ncbi:MAG: PQQ-binding-like beta-propeller repeat protein, partial [Candidatus Firestonebacteria bacterium]